MRRALKTRIAVSNLLIVASALTLFAVLLYLWVSSTLYRHHDGDLADDARRVLDAINTSPSPLNTLGELDAAAATRPLLLVRDSHGQILFRSSRLLEIEPDIGAHTVLTHAATRGATTTQFFTVRLARGLVRFICVPLEHPAGTYLQYGRSLGDVDLLLRVVIIASAVLVPLVIVLTSFGGFAIAKRALAPVDRIASTLESIQATDLSRRVNPHTTDAEVARLTSSINRLLDRLHSSFAALREFTADVSHQLLTPLTVMRGTIDVAANDRRSRDDVKVLHRLRDEVDALSATLQDLRDYALADADSAAAGAEPVDVSSVFAEAADVVRALAEADDVQCDVAIAPGLMVWGNAVRLRQVLLNLGENAVQFTPAGGRISIQASADHGNVVRLSVEDTGAGIAPDLLPHVFSRHFHVRRPDSSTGAGLGLAIVKRIVDAHSGQVTIASTVGRGTTVEVTLPIARPLTRRESGSASTARSLVAQLAQRRS